MAVYQTIFNLFLYFTEGLIIFFYANSFFKQKYNSKITIIGITFLHTIRYLLCGQCNTESCFFACYILFDNFFTI